MLVAAQARTDCIEEQTGAEPILPADIELVAMEADTDNSNCPPGNSESLVVYYAPNFREKLEVPPFDLVAHYEPNALGQLDSQRVALADCQVFQTQLMYSLNLAAESAEQLVASVGFAELAAPPAALAVSVESAVAGLRQQ